jgi:hypothetical protein
LTVEWHDSQLVVDTMWVALLPVARVPSWQLTQLPVTPAWLNVAGIHAMVEWQLLHSAAVRM